jgi:hypothetical protein
MNVKTKKATFSLRTDVLAALDQAVAQGAAPSKNALIEQAINRELKEFRKQARLALWQAGAQDKHLLQDIEEISQAFRTADAETTPGAD